eukprot:Skav207039  [mRNA]  locus=scaffold975:13131:17686:- [translate_table: standard]
MRSEATKLFCSGDPAPAPRRGGLNPLELGNFVRAGAPQVPRAQGDRVLSRTSRGSGTGPTSLLKAVSTWCFSCCS